MSDHTWTTHQESWSKDFKCEICGRTFYSIDALESHKRAMNHSAQFGSKPEEISKDFKCGKCAFAFFSSEALERHETVMKHKSKSKEDDETTSNLDEETVKVLGLHNCKLCSFESFRMDEISKHMRRAHKVPHSCEFCDYTSPSRYGCRMAKARFLELYVFGPLGFWTMDPLR